MKSDVNDLTEVMEWRKKCQAIAEKLTGDSQAEILQQLENDHQHYLSCLNFCKNGVMKSKDSQALLEGLFLISSLSRFWWMRGYSKKIKSEMEFFISQLPNSRIDELVASGAYFGAGMIYYSCADYKNSRKCYETAFQGYLKVGRQKEMADCWNGLGMIEREEGNYDLAKEKHLKSFSIYESIRNEWGMAHTLSNLGVVEYRAGREKSALEYHKKALEIRLKIKDALGLGSTYGNLAALEVKNKDYQKAKQFYSEALKIREGLGDIWGIAGAHLMLGTVDTFLESYASAKFHFSKCIQCFMAVGDRLGFAETLEALVYLKSKERDFQNCAILLGAADRARSRINAPLPLPHSKQHKEVTSTLLSNLPANEFEVLKQRGQSLTQQQSLELCVSLLNTTNKL